MLTVSLFAVGQLHTLRSSQFTRVSRDLVSLSAYLYHQHGWLARWYKIHKVYIHSHSMLLLLFTNMFIHIQQPNLHLRNIFIHIYRCIFIYDYICSHLRDVLIHIQRVISIYIHDRNIHSAFGRIIGS